MTLIRYALAALVLTAVLGLATSSISGAPAGPQATTLSDTAVLTKWTLPLSRGPWQMKWDDSRGRIWFSEGNHISPPLDRIASFDPATNLLREWNVITPSSLVHGNALDRTANVWFTEVAAHRVGRLEPETNTLTEWTLHPDADPHGITVDDILSTTVTVWISERGTSILSSLNPATGEYRRHEHPFSSLIPQPHGVTVAPDHSIWFVETCGNRVGRLEPGTADVWTFWEPPTQVQCGNPNIGPLFGQFIAGDYWYSEPTNGNVIRLQPASNTFTIWPVPGGAANAKQVTQIGGAPDGTIFFTEMKTSVLGRLEPVGATTPMAFTVDPTVVSQATPLPGTAPTAVAVRTAIMTQLTPQQSNVPGTRTGSFTEWPVSVRTPYAGFIGAARAWYGGGAFWASETSENKIVRLAPFTPVPSATPTEPATATAAPSATETPPPPSATNTPPAPSETMAPPVTMTPAPPTGTAVPPSTTASPGATATPTLCPITFSDVHPTDYFYPYVQYLYCHNVISGYSDNTFRPGNATTRGQMVKIVVLGFGTPIVVPPGGGYTFADVPAGSVFFPYVETAAANGIVSGYQCGGPNEPCDPANRPYFRAGVNVTRGQLAKIDAATAGWQPQPPSTATFADVPVGSPFFAYVEAAACRGVISGYGCGGPGEPCDVQNRPYYRQGNSATRGQISKIVYLSLGTPAACAPPR
ncbi:MAG TPA: S-layer homology domain-containing protein [Chloroflexia bacterium]|nr:S-layer homology domain-containing protein [Chloroflexia bacterium]